MNDGAFPHHPVGAALWVSVQGLAHLWDRRAAELAGQGAAEAYQRAAAEAQEVLRTLAGPGRLGDRRRDDSQQELPL